MSHKLEKRCEARQNEIRDGSVLVHVTKRIAAITPPRALVVLRFLLNKPQNALCIRKKITTRSLPNSYTRSAETGEIFGLNRPGREYPQLIDQTDSQSFPILCSYFDE